MTQTDLPKPMARRRAKAVAKTQTLLGGQGTCRMYGFGVTGPDPQRSWLMIVGGAIAIVVFLALAVRVLVVPGWLGIGLLRWAINTPRGVGVADEGMVVTRESFWNARPTSVIALLPLDALYAQTATTKSHVRVQLGAEHIWLRRTEYDILLAAAKATAHTV